MTTIFNAAHFKSDEAARLYIEAARWPNGPICGHCGETERRYETKRAGRYRCGNPKCRKDYTVTTGMVMESSHIKLHVWLMAFHLAASSKKGFSAHQIHRTLGITYKSAWFLHHRIMEAMRTGKLDLPPLGGAGKVVEADETYYGPVEKPRTQTARKHPYTKAGRSGPSNKRAILALVERGGNVRTFHVPRADKVTVSRIVTENISRESRLHTDESKLYFGADLFFADHETVTHSKKEYVRGDVHTNTAEGYFSIFKRGMRGVYQHCSEKHLHRYLAEFDFRYNRRTALGWNDEMRTLAAVQSAEGKRLTYKKSHQA
jgi:transposase-like protein